MACSQAFIRQGHQRWKIRCGSILCAVRRMRCAMSGSDTNRPVRWLRGRQWMWSTSLKPEPLPLRVRGAMFGLNCRPKPNARTRIPGTDCTDKVAFGFDFGGRFALAMRCPACRLLL
eukprot:3941964-Rhodomonas_salina.2